MDFLTTPIVSIIVAVAGITLTVVLGCVGSILANDFHAWVPTLVARLIRTAVIRLPENHRDRYHEEWTQFVNDVPGDVAKLWHALGLVFAAVRRSQVSHGSKSPQPKPTAVEPVIGAVATLVWATLSVTLIHRLEVMWRLLSIVETILAFVVLAVPLLLLRQLVWNRLCERVRRSGASPVPSNDQ